MRLSVTGDEHSGRISENPYKRWFRAAIRLMEDAGQDPHPATLLRNVSTTSVENLAEGFAEIFGTVGFGNNAAESVCSVVSHDGVVGIAA
jgi:hypothetical protein